MRQVTASHLPARSVRWSGNARAPFTAQSSVWRSLTVHAGGQRVTSASARAAIRASATAAAPRSLDGPALAEADHAVMGGNDLPHLRMVEKGDALHRGLKR